MVAALGLQPSAVEPLTAYQSICRRHPNPRSSGEHCCLTIGSLSTPADLDYNTLLEWRLWAITGAAKARDIQVLFLPGARLPPGTILPQILGFCFLGPRSTQWDTVGLLCAVEMEPLLVPLDDFSTDRVFWLQC